MNKLFFLLALLCFTLTLMGQQNRGYLNITSFGLLVGTSAGEKPAPLSLLTEHHYQFNKALSLGFMTGIEQLNENTLPVALNLKAYLPAGSCRFFISGLGGYSISLEKPDYEGLKKAIGGFMAGTEAGILIRVNSCSAIVVALGYRYNSLNYKLNDWWLGNYTRKINYNRFSVRIGFAIY